eukprot:IDg6327t1
MRKGACLLLALALAARGFSCKWGLRSYSCCFGAPRDLLLLSQLPCVCAKLSAFLETAVVYGQACVRVRVCCVHVRAPLAVVPASVACSRALVASVMAG